MADEIIYDALDASEDKDYTDDAIVSIAVKNFRFFYLLVKVLAGKI